MPYRTLLSIFSAAVVAIAFTICDYLILDDIIPNRGPIWTTYGIIKTVVAVGIAVWIIASIYADGRSSRSDEAPAVAVQAPVILSHALAWAFVLLFAISPSGFNWLGLEDNVVEYFSALLCLAGSVFFLGAFLAARRLPDGGTRRRVTLLFAPFGALVLFLIGMEEISWMQRIFDFSTPESFAANRQGEVNLHNFFTTPVHSVYRVGSWAVLILLPFMAVFGPRLRLLDLLRDFVPPPWVAVLAAPIACFNYNAWPFFPTQVVAFSSLLIMAVFWTHAQRGGRSEGAWLFAATIVLIVAAQAVFLVGGERFIRHWDVTEYQEFFMAMGLTAAAWSARERVRARSGQLQSRVSTQAVKY